MIAEYSINLANKTKNELILFIKELQDILKEKDSKIERLKADNKKINKILDEINNTNYPIIN